MLEELIGNILQAEDEAEKIVRDAQTQAREIVSRAKDEAAGQLRTSAAELKKQYDDVMVNANYIAERQRRQIAEDAAAEGERLKQTARDRRAQAIDAIIGKLNEKYDC